MYVEINIVNLALEWAVIRPDFPEFTLVKRESGEWSGGVQGAIQV